MGVWGSVYAHKWEDCKGICEWCGFPIKGRGILHHKINRCQSGRSTYENAELRHSRCEHEAHRDFKYGNREGNLNAKQRRTKKREYIRNSEETTTQTRTTVVVPSGQGHQEMGVVPTNFAVIVRLEWTGGKCNVSISTES